MERLGKLESMGSWIALAAFTVFSAMVADTALAQSITTTKHNLGTLGSGSVKLATGTTEICVFCHTPHGGDTAKSAPLWNRTSGGTAFAVYDGVWGGGDRPSTLDGAVLPVGSISTLCLSCHDGSTALDLLINAPGSGGYNTAGARPVGWTWPVGVGAGGVMPAGITNLGPDLKNDHPIGVPYCGGKGTGGGSDPTTLTGCKDQDFNVAIKGTDNFFWVDNTIGGTTGVREKTDMILYTRDFTSLSATTGVWPSVECGSCHDPHNSTNPTFLRMANTGSQLCLTCHNK